MSHIRYILVLAAVLIFSSCSVPTAQPEVIPPENTLDTGTLDLKLSAVAPWLAPYVKSQGSSRAYLFATSVTIQIKNSGGSNVINPVTQTLNLDNTSGSTSGALSEITGIPSGTNYTVTVYITNSAQNSWTKVIGTKTGVDITKNTNTAVEIVCIPNDYTTISANNLASFNLPAYGEVWYKFTSLADQEYTLKQNGVGLQAFLFDSLGEYVGTSTNADPLVFTTPSASDYYIGIAGKSTSATSNVLLEAVFPPANEGSIASPINLTVDAADRTFKLGIQGAADQYSYYTFTTGGAGDYALKTGANWYINWTVYTDSSFTTVEASGNYDSDFTVEDLTASTQYYIRLRNNHSYAQSLSGRLISPDEIDVLRQNEGTRSSPVSIALSTTESTTIGTNSYDDSSYFTFTTGTQAEYEFAVSNSTSANPLYFYIGTDSTFSTASQSYTLGNETEEILFSPSTTYYLKIVNNDSKSISLDLNINPKSIVPVAAIATTPDLGYVNGSLAVSGGAVWYEVTVPSSGIYKVNWNDGFEGDGTKNLDVSVSAYNEDLSSVLFHMQDSAWTTYASVNVPSGQTKFWLKVVAFNNGSGTGTFAVKIASPSEGSLSITIR